MCDKNVKVIDGGDLTNVAPSILDYMESSHEHKLPNGTLTFEDGEGDKAILAKYVGEHAEHEVVIPQKVGAEGSERFITVIGAESFYYCTSVTSVVIPEGDTEIRDYAFAGCTGLKSVTIPASVTTIAKGAFKGCSSLEEIKLADGSVLTSIGDYAFYDCSALESITLPEGLVSIGKLAFNNCDALTEVKTPATLKSIGDMAFYDCDGFTTENAIVLHEALTTIGEFVFGSISKECISAPAGSVAAEYIGSMNSGEVEESTTEESSDETTEETTEESSEETSEVAEESSEETTI